MNRRVAFPFFTLSETAVDASPWLVSVDDRDWEEVGEFLADWDYSSTIRIQRQLRIDPEIASADLAVPVDELSLSARLRLGTGQGRLPRLLLRQENTPVRVGSWSVPLEAEIAGGSLSSVLDVFAEVVLGAAPVSQVDALSPDQAGLRLWWDRHRLRLEGEEPRFPIEVVDLEEMLGNTPAAFAPWYLRWSPHDWSRDFHGAIRLYLNSRHGEVVERIEQGDAHTLQGLMADVMGQICERLVTDPAAAEIVEQAEPGTLAAQAASWLAQAWPGQDVAAIRSVAETRPGKFHATIFALAQPPEG